VVTPLGPYYSTGKYREPLALIEAACQAGGSSFHGSGVHPGFAGDILPLTIARTMNRIDHIHVYEVIDHLANPSKYIEFMGFGRTPDDVLANPGRSPDAPYIFAQSMAMLADGLGEQLDEVITSKLELATATTDIHYGHPQDGRVIRAGTVAGQHYEWTASIKGKPFITFHCFWIMGYHDIAPQWDCGDSGYRLRFEGDPPLALSLSEQKPDGRLGYPGLSLTALLGVNAIPAVCAAAPGVATHLDLGVVQPHGLVRA
jgi:hypothetical protein